MNSLVVNIALASDSLAGRVDSATDWLNDSQEPARQPVPLALEGGDFFCFFFNCKTSACSAMNNDIHDLLMIFMGMWVIVNCGCGLSLISISESWRLWCKCDPDLCQNKTRVADPDAQTVPDVALPVKEDVQRYYATHSKKDLENLLVAVASRCPQLWKSISTSEKQVDPEKPYLQPPWCKCGKCHMEGDAEDQVCCKNHPKNHENPYFFQLCLDQQTLELALVNNCDWLNMPRIYTNSKFRNTAYRQYILWFHGKLGYRKRKRIPSCIKWAIRDMYPGNMLDTMRHYR